MAPFHRGLALWMYFASRSTFETEPRPHQPSEGRLEARQHAGRRRSTLHPRPERSIFRQFWDAMQEEPNTKGTVSSVDRSEPRFFLLGIARALARQAVE